MAERKGDLEAAAGGETSLACYEPLFGYRGEALHAQLVPGDAALEREGFLNLNHPGCLIYSRWLGCDPWSKIPSAQKENFTLFAQSKAVEDWVPAWHRVLIWVSFSSLGLVVAVLIGTLFQGRKND